MNYYCDNCGGQLFYSPKLKGCKCEKCGTVFPANSNFSFEKRLFTDELLENSKVVLNAHENIKCGACGAVVSPSQFESDPRCPYCNNPLQSAEQRGVVKVNSIIPFYFTKSQAYKKLKRAAFWHFSTNRKIISKIKEEDIVGEYINVFTFDMNAFCHYSGVFTYREKDADGNEFSGVKRKNVVGMIDKPYHDILIEANSNLNQTELLDIMPFDFSVALKFDETDNQLYPKHTQDKTFAECVNLAELVIRENLKNIVPARHNCDEAESITMDLDLTEKRYNYCLLPVYFVETSTRYKKKGVEHERRIKLLINGQTGKISEMPKSSLRFLLWLFSGCALIVAIILFFIFVV